MGSRLIRQAIAIALLVPLLGAGGISCAHRSGRGFNYTVQSGDNLYRIGQRYGVSSDALKRANGIRDVRTLRPGQELWIPNGRLSKQARKSGAAGSATSSAAASRGSSGTVRAAARDEARSEAKLSFIWPLKGRLTSRFGTRDGRPHEGLDVAARSGTKIRAAEAGKVIHSGRLGAYGNVVIVKHSGNYRSVYAHARKTLVRRGQFVEKGDRIAEVGSTGRSTGPHLHFEIRRRETPKDPMLYLP